MLKRLTGFLLVICLLFSMCPVLATETQASTGNIPNNEAITESIFISGGGVEEMSFTTEPAIGIVVGEDEKVIEKEPEVELPDNPPLLVLCIMVRFFIQLTLP